MKNNKSLLLLMMILSFQLHGQVPSKDKLNKVLHHLYPDERAPGISVLITRNGQPLYSFQKGLANLEDYVAINHAVTRFRMASVSKQVTARAVYRLVENKQLDLNRPLSIWFEELPDSWKDVTPKHLLNHSSGIWDYEDLIPKGQKQQLSDQDVLQLARQKDTLYFATGSRFRYSNTGYCLLALLVEKVSGEPFDDFVKQQLFQPIGITDALVYRSTSSIKDRAYGYHPQGDTFVFADQSITSATQGDGGVYFSAEDYHLWVNKQLFRDFQKEDFNRLYEKNAIPVKDNVFYNIGLFGFYNDENNLYLFHSGESTGFHNIVYIDLQKKLIISIFTNRDDLQITTAFEEIRHAMKLKSPVQSKLFDWLSKVYSDQE